MDGWMMRLSEVRNRRMGACVRADGYAMRRMREDGTRVTVTVRTFRRTRYDMTLVRG